MLMARPYFPSVKYAFNNGSFRILLRAMQEMDTRYDDNRAHNPREVIWLNAIVEPMLIKEKAEAMKVVVMTAFKGISQPNVTWVQVSINVLKDGKSLLLKKTR